MLFQYTSSPEKWLLGAIDKAKGVFELEIESEEERCLYPKLWVLCDGHGFCERLEEDLEDIHVTM